jgi:crotonobetainyl-CoA:carnitine CoA-transferase CaiB-like acyl-CoA transferase
MTEEQKQRPGPLDGVKVLDLSRFIAGPICAQTLGDLGAEVLKVERPGGEDARHHEPFYEGESVYTMLYNRNKYGITLDTRHRRALGILERLVAWADVVVENYRPDTLDKIGIGYDRMRHIKPDIILVSISGFGQTGPDSRRALFDAIAQAMSGLMSITGEPDRPPMLTGTYVADYLTGEKAAVGALAAILHRLRTGEGQQVDVASLDSTFSILGTRLIAYLMLGLDIPRNGSRDLLTAPGNVYQTHDGPMYIQAGTDGLFRRLCQAMGREDLLEAEEFRDVPTRMANADLADRQVAAWAATRTSAEVGAALDSVGVPNARVLSIPEVVTLPQLKARDMIVDVEHPQLGTLTIPGTPVKMEKSPPSIRKAPPTVGEDNDEVYGRILGLAQAEIQSLRDDGVI